MTHVHVNDLKLRDCILLHERPCKIVQISYSKGGKNCRIHITGIDILNERKYEGIFRSTDLVFVPEVTRSEYPLLDISDEGWVSLLLPDGNIKDNIQIESESELERAYQEGQELIVSVISVTYSGSSKERIIGYHSRSSSCMKQK